MVKKPIYLETDLNYYKVTMSLPYKGNVEYDRLKCKRGRFTFTLTDDPIFTGVTIQITSHGKINIYIPEGAPEDEIIEKVLKVISEANGKKVNIISETTEDAYEKYIKKRSLYKIAKILEDLASAQKQKDPYEPLYFQPHRLYRPYREIYEKLMYFARRGDPFKAKEYLEGLCSLCQGRKKDHPPALEKLCSECEAKNTNLYKLAKQKLSKYIQKIGKMEEIEFQRLLCYYLSYEYKTELIILSYKELKLGLKEVMEDEWLEKIFDDIDRRLSGLDFIDSTLEPTLMRDHLYQMLNMPTEIAEEYLRIGMETVKWHILNEISDDPGIYKKFDETVEEYYENAVPILNKSRQRKNLLKRVRKEANIRRRMRRLRRINAESKGEKRGRGNYTRSIHL